MEQTAGHATRTAGARRATLEADDWESGERLGGALDVATGDIGLAGDTSRATGHDISKLCGRLSPASARSAPTCLRLVHDVSIRGPGRPGWAVYCAASGEVRQRSLTVSVVIPAMNEALNLPSVLPQIPRVGTEVVIVDGHSSDDTLGVVHELRPDAKVVEQAAKGKGAALAAGFAAARGDIIIMIDADGSMSPREFAAFVDALVRGADFVKGSRNLSGGGSADLTFLRNLGNRGLGAVFNLLHGTKHTDLCYGYMAFWRSSLTAVMPDTPGFEVETWMNIRAAQAGLQVCEVPSFEGRRVYGHSNLNPVRDGLRVLRTLVTGGATRRSPGA